jgi:transposase-like protein
LQKNKNMQKPQISKSEGQALVERWKSSGKSISEYCREHSIPSHRINYWKKRVETLEGDKAEGNKFLSIELQNNSDQARYEVQTPKGYIIRLYTAISLSDILRQID